MRQHHIVTLLLAALLVGGTVTGAAAVASTDVSINDDHETLSAMVTVSTETTVTVDVLDSDGTTVMIKTLNSTGESFPTTLETTVSNLTPGDYTVDLSATNSSAVDNHSVTVSYTEPVTAENETVFVDVTFIAADTATVELGNETRVLEATSAELAETDSVIKTAEFDNQSGTLTPTVEYGNSTAISNVYVSTGDSGGLLGGGTVGGASTTRLLVFALIATGAVYAYRTEMI